MRVIKMEGYIARDKEDTKDVPGELTLYKDIPVREKNWWKGKDYGLDIDAKEFPEITWDKEPVKCLITITTMT